MHFTTLSALCLAAMPMITVNALNYHVYSSTNTCDGSGSSFGCSDDGGVCCGSFPSAYGYSAQFDNLPTGTQGQGYKDSGCKTYRFTVYGPGTQCWKSGGSGRIESLNWFHSQSKRVVRPRSDNETEACSPHFFSYPDAEGKMVDIKVEDAAHAEHIAQLYEQNDLTALADFEEYQS